jgi:hypothetical protein
VGSLCLLSPISPPHTLTHTCTPLSLSFSCPYVFLLPSFMIRPHPCILSCSLQDRRRCCGLGPVAWRPGEGRPAATSLSCGPGLQRERSWGHDLEAIGGAAWRPKAWRRRKPGSGLGPGGDRELLAWGGRARRLWSGAVHCVHVIDRCEFLCSCVLVRYMCILIFCLFCES